MDHRPDPPEIQFQDPYTSLIDFRGGRNLVDALLDKNPGASTTAQSIAAAASPAGSALPQSDISRYVDMTQGRGY